MKEFEFIKEAKQIHKLLVKLRLLPAGSSRPTAKRLRLTYKNKAKSIKSKLTYLYGKDAAEETFSKIERKIIAFRKKKTKKLRYRDANFDPLNRFTQKDAILITYPDSIYDKAGNSLNSLKEFAEETIKGSINTIHILPFYPSSSDRGFSVINYKKVDDRFGEWSDISAISNEFNLMFDGVFNHISAKSLWFRKYLKNDPKYSNHFISFKNRNEISKENLKKIVRPRTTPLLTEFKAKDENRYIWTTFSSDQVDLNYKEPRVLLRIIDIIIRYICKGATIIRLDAIGYIWKELGTGCINLKQTHVIVQLMREILDMIAPSVSLVTETNIPHAQNIKYLGNGRNESQMIYNFALPPLVLYTFYKGNSKYISRWADRLENISKYSTYFNFLASHDGIGLQPLKRVLPQKEVKFLIKEAKKRGSLVEYKSYGDGKKQPYELNITWGSALLDDQELQIRKYIASHAIQLSLKGVPGIYIHSLFGTKNDIKDVEKTKHSRDINRKNLDYGKIKEAISKETITKEIFENMLNLLKIRASHKAFHPSSEQKILLQNEGIFSLIRTSVDKTENILVLINVTRDKQEFEIDCKKMGMELYELISKKKMLAHGDDVKVSLFNVILEPYEVKWIKTS